MRADRVGVATPNLDQLARRGVIFENATAHVPLTLPSHASILTGQYPTAHHVSDNAGFPLPAGSATLAETLHARGYHTAAFVASYVLNRGTGLARGFDTYADRFDPAAPHLSLSSLQRRGPEVARDAVAWLANAPHPFFLWVHFYDPHAPYDPPPAFARQYPGRPYEGEIATSDWALGEVLRAIDARSRNALLVVTADHGESLGEHGEPEHGIFLYDSTLRVPLVVAGPSVRGGRRIPQQVRHVDIVPTVLEFAHVSPSAGLDGLSLKPVLEGTQAATSRASYAESAFGRLHLGWSDLRALRDGEWKYIEAPDRELYNVRTDPGERSNLLQAERQRAGALAQTLSAVVRSSSNAAGVAGRVASVDAERLKTLGYVSGQVDLGSAGAGGDPKAHIRQYVRYVSQFTEALDALQAGQARRAERIFERLAVEFPLSFEVHQYLGRSRAARGAHVEALRSFDTAHRLSPQTAMIDFDAARSLAEVRDYGQALTRVERGLSLEPDTFYGYVAKGQIHRAAGQRDDAIAAFRKALALSPGLPVAEYELGALAEQAGNTGDALGHYRRALSGDAAMSQARAGVTRLERRQ